MKMATLSREDRYSKAAFEWIKTERAGDISKFAGFDFENGVEYVRFLDNTRIRIELLGDVVLVHENPSEVLGRENFIEIKTSDSLYSTPVKYDNSITIQETPLKGDIDPVVHIFEKTKKINSKFNLSVNVKLISTDIYKVIRENFDNVDEILVDNLVEQISGKVLREAIRKEVQNIYFPKKEKKTDGRIDS